MSMWSIDWQKEAKCITLSDQEMISKLEELKETRRKIGEGKKFPLIKRALFELNTYQITVLGDYVRVYLY